MDTVIIVARRQIQMYSNAVKMLSHTQNPFSWIFIRVFHADS